MTVHFAELAGSPAETHSLDHFKAQRKLLIAWEDRAAFVAEIMQGNNGTPVWYPQRPTAIAVLVTIQPLDPSSPDAQEITSLTEGLNSYSNSYAKALVEYRDY